MTVLPTLTCCFRAWGRAVPPLFRPVGGEHGVYRGPGRLVTVGPDVPVGVEGGLGARMPQPCLDRLDVGAIRDEQTGEIVPQVVIAEARRKVPDFAADFPHCPLDRPRRELAAVQTSQERFMAPVGADVS
jgi:hypothetical protein